jgi:hypothetical protein
MPRKSKAIREITRYGIAELYGKSFVQLSAAERIDLLSVTAPSTQVCIPRSGPDSIIPCNKKGGVCSLRQYSRDQSSGVTKALSEPLRVSTTCPERFKELSLIYEWVGETILGNQAPIIVREVGFLIRPPVDFAAVSQPDTDTEPVDLDTDQEHHENVGQIDSVLVHPDLDPIQWCALEIQAVYFSGKALSREYEVIRTTPDGVIPFPVLNRRPDFRSSGPKRLMPQLQIKVPSLRRWGKKMAVVIDRSFFDALGSMEEVPHISNSDIAWFVVNYKEESGSIRMIRDSVHFTTLERAVEGLTAGRPVSLPVFEERIRNKLRAS